MLRSQSSMHRLVRHHLVVETKPNGDHRPFGFAFGHGHKIEAHTVLDELQHLVVVQRRLAITKAHAHRLKVKAPQTRNDQVSQHDRHGLAWSARAGCL